MLTNRQKLVKRCFDIILSFLLLILTSPLIGIAWIIASIETKTNGFFIQERVGKSGKVFYVIKIRTMFVNPSIKTTVTSKDDIRITKFGYFFRRTKIDELPQLLNVLWGHMSFVGPRPDVPGFADKLTGEDKIILDIRPGITGPATLYYRDEESLLTSTSNPEEYNLKIIFPHKVFLNKEYIKNYSFTSDLKYIYKTLLC